jgi:hypothetical protein
MSSCYFYDLPVYRLSREAYYKAQDEHIEAVLFPENDPLTAELRKMDKANTNSNATLRGHLERRYGGCWEFNEVVGYIRLHFLGTQVRGEYFAVAKKRIVRTRTKTFEYQAWKLAPEVDIEPPFRNAEILAAVLTYIEDCRREVPKRFIDTSIFEMVAPHINWVEVLH